MQKNLVIALILTSIVWIVWYTWVVPPPNQKNNLSLTTSNTSNVQNEKKKDEKYEIPKNLNIKPVNNITVAYEIKYDKTKFILTPSLAIKRLIYSGPVQDVNLVLDEEKPFLSLYDITEYLKKYQNDNEIEVSGKIGQDIEINKKLIMSKNEGLNILQINIKNKSRKKLKIPATELSIGPGINTVKSEEKENHKIWQAVYAYHKEGKKNPVIEKIKSDIKSKNFIWAAVENRYFIFAVLNKGEVFSDIKFYEEKINEHSAPYIKLVVGEINLSPLETKKIEIPFYSGPKSYENLKKIGYGLHLSIDFGFFAPLAKIANNLLKKIYGITHNYGFAIIILSLIVQIIMLPLTFKSYKAMAIMKKMQPEMKSIQEKYKDNPQRMNLELMNLYKKYGANPFSGCWPMLLQIPIFFALFTTLRNSWDLHGAKFIFWIKDLSDKDPYFILPILMGALMFLQNYLSPTSTQDPSQTVVMKWMPLIFTFLFLTFPSGLVIYWIVNSVSSIFLNYYMKQKGYYS